MFKYVADSFKSMAEKRKNLRSSDRRRSCLILRQPMRSPVLRYISRCRMTSLRESATMGSVSIKRGRVTEEWLNAKAKTARKYSTLFYRGTADEELDLSGFPKSSRDNIQVALENKCLPACSRVLCSRINLTFLTCSLHGTSYCG